MLMTACSYRHRHRFLGFQWWIYDTFKTSMGLGTTGGK